METWLSAARASRQRYTASLDPLSDEWDLEPLDEPDDTLLGPDELAELLQVQRATIRQWRARGILPPADLELSGLPIWRHATVTSWACHTRRTLEESPR
jgi:hypothetical protein